MNLGIRKRIKKMIIFQRYFLFQFYKYFLGFEYASIYLKTIDKETLKRILVKNNANIGENCDIETGLFFHNCRDFSNLIIGNNCHVGKNCFFDLRDKITIEDNVTISMNCSLITHQDVGKSDLVKYYPKVHNPIHIESNVYIGVGSTILMGCKIKKRSIVGAMSLVRENVDANIIVAGLPARTVKQL